MNFAPTASMRLSDTVTPSTRLSERLRVARASRGGVATVSTQVRTMGKPPAGVKLTMEACCIMFNVKPEMEKNPDGLIAVSLTRLRQGRRWVVF